LGTSLYFRQKNSIIFTLPASVIIENDSGKTIANNIKAKIGLKLYTTKTNWGKR